MSRGRDRTTDGDGGDDAPPSSRARADGGDGVTVEPGPRPHAPSGYDRRTTVIARSTVRIVVPIILVTAVSLLLQGHNLPGGGFIGAVLTATAFVLVYVVFGIDYLAEVLGVDGGGRLIAVYRATFAGGLALAAGSGLVPIALGTPFLTQGFVILEHVPLYGEFEVASALAFDVGVYLTVVGALLTVVGEVGAE